MAIRRKKLLVADDIAINRLILRALFEKDFDVLETENGIEALRELQNHSQEIAVVLLDLEMPEMDGFGVLRGMRESGLMDRIPVVMISGSSDDVKTLQSYKLGVSDLIEKPFNADITYRRVRNVVDLYTHKRGLEEQVEDYREQLREQTKKIRKSNQFIIDALSTTVEFRSLESGEHVKRVRILTKALLKRMRGQYHFSDDEIEIISGAAAIHDIGKIAIPDSILHKPGRLTPEEFEIMKTHTVRGGEILQNLEFFRYYYDICRHHHERWDGGGYPDGLRGDEISIWAQATGLADVYDALVNERVYKRAYSHDKAVEMIVGNECGVFGPQLLKNFLAIQEELRDSAAFIRNNA